MSNKVSRKDRFWERIPLKDLNQSQWESICDGCCQCCAHKLQDEETHQILKTNIVCRYLDIEKRRCTVYSERHKYVPDCIKVTPKNASQLPWMPETCGYRLLSNGQPLPKWHPLETGKENSTQTSGQSVTGKVISEEDINEDDIEDFVVSDDYFEKPLD